MGRIESAVGGVFGNPNDLATSMNLVIPLAVALALGHKGLLRWTYAACAVLLSTAVVVTFSRGGFLGLMTLAGVLLCKSRHHKPAMAVVLTAMSVVILVLVIPTSYGDRLFTIFAPAADTTGSAQQRQAVLQRGALVAVRHSLIGVGMGNFHIYSVRDLKAHNSYLEIWTELGLAGLAAYLTLLFASIRSLRHVELVTMRAQQNLSNDSYYLSLGLQATLAAYIVCSFFASIQYQWFLYYPVAYAVALRRICNLETIEPWKANSVKTAGTLWSLAREGSLWHAGWMRRTTAHRGFRRLSPPWLEKLGYGH